MLGSTAEVHIPDARVLAEGGLDQEEVARICRLRFYVRLVQHGPATLWAILRACPPAKGDWFAQVDGDLEWLVKAAAGEDLVTKREPSDSLREWAAAVMGSDPGRWRAMVARTSRRVQLLKKLKFEWEDWDKYLVGDVAAARSGAEAGGDGYECPQCRKAFGSFPAVMLHLYRSHGAKSAVREFAGGTRCPSCLMEFHTNGRYFVHLHTVPACCYLVRKWWEADGSGTIGDGCEQGGAPSYAGLQAERLPAFRVAGPISKDKFDARRCCPRGDMDASSKLARFLGSHTEATEPGMAGAATASDGVKRRLRGKQSVAADEGARGAPGYGAEGGRSIVHPHALKKRRLSFKQADPHLFVVEPDVQAGEAEERPAAAAGDGQESGGAAEQSAAPRVRRGRIAHAETKIVLVVGKCPVVTAELKSKAGSGFTIVAWQGPFDDQGRPNLYETRDWASRVAEGAVAAVIWAKPACLGAFCGEAFRSGEAPWGTACITVGIAGLLRLEALAFMMGVNFLAGLHDAGGVGVMLFHKDGGRGLLKAKAGRLLGDGYAEGEAFVASSGLAVPSDAAIRCDRRVQKEMAQGMLAGVKGVAISRRPSEDEIAWFASFAEVELPVDESLPRSRRAKRKPFAFPLLLPGGPDEVCPDLNVIRLRADVAREVEEAAVAAADEGPGDMYCGLDEPDEDEATVVAGRDRGREAAEGLDDVALQRIERNRAAALEKRRQAEAAMRDERTDGGEGRAAAEALDEATLQRIEQNRSAAVARKRRAEAKRADAALRGLMVGRATTQEEDGVVSVVRRITLPHFGGS